jgi:hypothetical protein
MNQQDTINESIIPADLNAPAPEEIKGGPKRIFIGGLSINEAPGALLDLELGGAVKGGAYAKDAAKMTVK